MNVTVEVLLCKEHKKEIIKEFNLHPEYFLTSGEYAKMSTNPLTGKGCSFSGCDKDAICREYQTFDLNKKDYW